MHSHRKIWTMIRTADNLTKTAGLLKKIEVDLQPKKHPKENEAKNLEINVTFEKNQAQSLNEDATLSPKNLVTPNKKKRKNAPFKPKKADQDAEGFWPCKKQRMEETEPSLILSDKIAALKF